MFAPIILYLLSVAGGVWIAKSRNRWVAVPLCIMLPMFGLLLALMLKKRCPSCAEYMYPSAKVCPHCGRNWSSGDVTVKAAKSIAAVAFAAVCAISASGGDSAQALRQARQRRASTATVTTNENGTVTYSSPFHCEEYPEIQAVSFNVKVECGTNSVSIADSKARLEKLEAELERRKALREAERRRRAEESAGAKSTEAAGD